MDDSYTCLHSDSPRVTQEVAGKLIGHQASSFQLSISMSSLHVCKCHFKRQKKMARHIIVVSRGTSVCNREFDKKDFTDRGLWISLNQRSKDRQPGLLGWPGWYFEGPGSPSSVFLLQLAGGGSCSLALYLTLGHMWCHFCTSGRRASLMPPAACHSRHLQAVSCVFF